MKTTIDISKRTKGEWYAFEIGQNSFAIKEKSLPKGFSDRIAELHEYDAEANAVFIVKACNNYDRLVESLKDVLDYRSYDKHSSDFFRKRHREVIEKLKYLLLIHGLPMALT